MLGIRLALVAYKQIFQDVMLTRLCSGSLQVSHNCVWLGLDVKIHNRKQHTIFFCQLWAQSKQKKGFGLFLYKISANDTETKIAY